MRGRPQLPEITDERHLQCFYDIINNMSFTALLHSVPWHGVITTDDLYRRWGEVPVRQRLGGWLKSGKLVRVCKGVYAVNAPYRNPNGVHPYFLANYVYPGSYLSVESALEFHRMIPESIVSFFSVTSERSGHKQTPLGLFWALHINRGLDGVETYAVGDGQRARIASPERALLDLVWLVPKGGTPEHLDSLRLQNLDKLDIAKMSRLAEGSGKLNRAVSYIATLKAREAEEWQPI